MGNFGERRFGIGYFGIGEELSREQSTPEGILELARDFVASFRERLFYATADQQIPNPSSFPSADIPGFKVLDRGLLEESRSFVAQSRTRAFVAMPNEEKGKDLELVLSGSMPVAVIDEDQMEKTRAFSARPRDRNFVATLKEQEKAQV